MKKFITTIFLLGVTQLMTHGQNIVREAAWRDNILNALDTAKHDTSRILLTAELANYYKFNFPDSAIHYGYKALEWARKNKYAKGEVKALTYILFTHATLGNDAKALQVCLQALKTAENNHLLNDKAYLLSLQGYTYSLMNRYEEAFDAIIKSKSLSDSLHDLRYSIIAGMRLTQTYTMMNQPESASKYCLPLDSAYKLVGPLDGSWPIYYTLLNLGKIEEKRSNGQLALTYFRQALARAVDGEMVFECYFSIAKAFQLMNEPDSVIYYSNKSLEVVKDNRFYSNIIKANTLLSGIYEEIDPRRAIQHSKTAMAYKDSLDRLRNSTSFESLIAFDERERQYDIETATATYQSRIRQYVLIAGLLVFLLVAFLLYRNNSQKQKAKEKIEKAYNELKSTQSQLIQSEKMASLGELTAGIAHEIQNPLNFVNNFSEVNRDLIDEMQEQISIGNNQQAIETAKNIRENEEKIIQHGQRADAIVKGMLQHSRVSTGQKELTDINALCDEYLRLAYHGLRAKDKSFNATIKSDFDSNIDKLNIVPQDVGRAMLNLVNNAFYAVNEKHKQNGVAYDPTITVVTRKVNGKIEISVKDNANGIPQNILDKIFQPFFTTKPTGQGTGLGLSLAYDIVKAHGGEIKVNSREGEFTEFVVRLPANS